MSEFALQREIPRSNRTCGQRNNFAGRILRPPSWRNFRLRLGVPGSFLFRRGFFVSNSAPSSSATPKPKRPLSLGVIFLTLYIDLIGFSIIFPLGPDLLAHYLGLEGHHGVLGWLLAQSDALAHSLGRDNAFAAVLFGGVAIAGGSGTIWGVVAAVLIWGFSRSYLQLRDWDANGLVIVSGLLLLVSVTVPRLLSKIRDLIAHRSPRPASRGKNTESTDPVTAQPSSATAGHDQGSNRG